MASVENTINAYTSFINLIWQIEKEAQKAHITQISSECFHPPTILNKILIREHPRDSASFVWTKHLNGIFLKCC